MANPVGHSWQRIKAWLENQEDSEVDEINDPATPQQLQEAASAMSVVFPQDLVEFYSLFNGADDLGIFPAFEEYDDMAYGPSPLEHVMDHWNLQQELLDDGQFVDAQPTSAQGIANDFWNPGWIPFADNGAGDHICIDVAPTDAGTMGQVITHSHETGAHLLLADSLADYLQQIADDLEAGKYQYDEVYGICLADNDDDEDSGEE